jgi:large subunit ribosomal protein L18
MAGLRTQKLRRKEGKTDYKLRLNLLKSNKPRIVIRRTNKYFILQTVESVEAKDKVTKTLTSKELIKNGWDAKAAGSLKSVPAGYLTGKLFAKDLDKKTEYIIDLGMTRTIDGNRAFAVLKGLVDGGANINVNEKVFPSEERINGEHLKDDVKTMVSKVAEKIK